MRTHPYVEYGGKRIDYLTFLSKDFDIELSTVLALADVLGPNEDFDGLVTMLEDEVERRDF